VRLCCDPRQAVGALREGLCAVSAEAASAALAHPAATAGAAGAAGPLVLEELIRASRGPPDF
jgi:hypothetical protein